MNTYKQGLADEAALVARLSRHHVVTPSTEFENKVDDIDIYADGIPISIKSQHTAARTGNLVFELEVKWRETGEWTPSWYYNSKAVQYLIQVEDKVYRVEKDNLTDYVAIAGFDRETVNTAKNVAAQAEMNHPHAQARIGLISLDKLLAAGVAEEVFYPEAPRKLKHYIPRL